MDQDKSKDFRKLIHSFKIATRPYHHLIGKLYVKKCGDESSIEFHIILANFIQYRVREAIHTIILINGEIELFFDFLLSNETFFEYRNNIRNRLICAEKVYADRGVFGLFISIYNNRRKCLEMIELETKQEFACLVKKIKLLSEKIKVLRDKNNVLMYDQDSTVYINSSGSMLDVEEVKAEKYYYEDIKLRKQGMMYQIPT
jgi:hypothetical protein